MDASQSHEELDRAAEEALAEETTVEETQEEAVEEVQEEKTEEQKQRDAENAERSRLGRKVKTLEEQLTHLSTLLEQQTKAPVQEDEDAIITPENLPRYMQKLEEQRTTQQKQYEKSYTSEFAKIGSEDNNFDAVWQEMLANHNSIVSGDPSLDARLNYLAAENALLKKGPTNPVKGKGSQVNTAVNVPTSAKEKEKAMPKLDPVAEEFVKRMGIKQERVVEILNKPTPAHLRK